MSSTVDNALKNVKRGDESINKLMMELVDMEKNLETKSDVEPALIMAMARLKTYVTIYDSYRGFILYKAILSLLVSKGRGGRRELAGALAGAIQADIEKSRPKVEL